MNPADSATVVGRSMKFRGELSGTDDLLIDGEVDGVVRLPGGRITIGPEGRVRASLAAKDIVIAGRVQGEILATGTVRLLASAVVLGDIAALRFSMEEGSVLRGHIDPGKSATLAASAAMEGLGSSLPLQATPVEPEALHEPAATVPQVSAVERHGEGNHEPAEARIVEGSHTHFPAALAVAARQLEEVVAPEGEAQSGERHVNSGDSSELAETQV